jgi:iron complex transport system substrate-binding protein
VERIAVLEPDLVIVSADMHGRIISLLDNLSIPNFAVEPRNFDEVFWTIRTIGRLTNRGEGALRTVKIMGEKIALAGLAAERQGAPSVYWELSDDPMISAGRTSFVGEAIRLAGGRNIFDDLEKDWPLVSAEEVLIRRPEWILSGDDLPPHGAAFFGRRPGWNDIPAVKNGNIAAISADHIYRYGPRLADAVLEISAILYGGDL